MENSSSGMLWFLTVLLSICPETFSEPRLRTEHPIEEHRVMLQELPHAVRVLKNL